MQQTARALEDRTSGIGLALRAAALWLGTVGMSVLAAWVWLFSNEEGTFVLKQDIQNDTLFVATLPGWLVGAVAAAAMIGGVGALVSLRADRRLRGALAWCGNWIPTSR